MISEKFKQNSSKGLITAATHFFKLEASGGIILVIAAIFALLIANSAAYDLYNYILNGMDFIFGFESKNGAIHLAIQKSILLWINDGLMAIFFFLIGLEIKRELLNGELSSRERALLPAVAAVGGVLLPALIFFFLNKDIPENMSGWAIPAATDIAFALGVLALLGNRVPSALKVLLMAIAVIDDLVAILIIAIFYSHDLHLSPLYFAGVSLVGLFLLNKFQISKTTAYVILGFILWIAVLKSGIHATLAGVITAFFIPLHCNKNPSYSPLRHLEHALHPWVAFMVLPIFAFANAGVSFKGLGLDALADPVALGIAAGLFFGKQAGIFLCMLAVIGLKLSPKPRNTTWLQLYAVAVLCGIGFTMSLFIGGLAYTGQEMAASVRIGVIIGSLLSAFIGYGLMHYATRERAQEIKAGKIIPAQNFPGDH